jgi:catechol 2,3-dioxygenase-like lactoylglutathione lyase family enzyme
MLAGGLGYLARIMTDTKSLIPLVITDDLAATKAFYTEALGFSVTFDLDDYLQVRYGDGGPELAFYRPGSLPGVGRVERFDGRGLVLSIATADADVAHATMTARGVVPLSAPSDKPWRWRSFSVADPSGVVLDFFHVLPQSAALDATG